jgi:zinc/manganese transport system substrate-binding protein
MDVTPCPELPAYPRRAQGASTCRRRVRGLFRAIVPLLGLGFGTTVLLPGRAALASKLQVVTTIETLAALAAEVGGSRIDVQSLSRGYQDPHFVPAKPSLILTLNRADALVYVGLDLESGWLPPLVQQSRNPRIQAGQPGNINGSTAIRVEDIPSVPADQLRALGDVHPLGNPHYWLPPDNARALADLMARRFSELDPAGADTYRSRWRAFDAKLAAKSTEWQARAAQLRGRKVVTYHKSWGYLTHWLGLDEVGYVEPKPGIPPTAFHTGELIKLMKQAGVHLILMENYYPRSLADIIARNTGARVLALPANVGGVPTARTYFELVDGIVSAIAEGAGPSGPSGPSSPSRPSPLPTPAAPPASTGGPATKPAATP